VVSPKEKKEIGLYNNREEAASMVTAGATANTTEGNCRASRESGLLCSHSHGESMEGVGGLTRTRA